MLKILNITLSFLIVLNIYFVQKAYILGFNLGVANEQTLIAYCQENNNLGLKDENFCVESIYGSELEQRIGAPPEMNYFKILKQFTKPWFRIFI